MVGMLRVGGWQARMDAIRAKKAGGKLAELQEQRAKAHKRTAKVC